MTSKWEPLALTIKSHQGYWYLMAILSTLAAVSGSNGRINGGDIQWVFCRRTDPACLARCLNSSQNAGEKRCLAAASPNFSGNQLTGELACRPVRYLPPMSNVTVIEPTDTRVQLKWLYNWGRPGFPEDGEIRYNCSLDNLAALTALHGLARNDRRVARYGWSIPQRQCVRLVDLLPHQSYTCKVWAQQGERRSWPVTRQFSTKFGKPQLPVAGLRAKFYHAAASSVRLHVQWSHGLQENLRPAYRMTVEKPFDAAFVTRNTSVHLVIGSQRLASQWALNPEAEVVNITVVPFNDFGDGPAQVLKARLPPYKRDSSLGRNLTSCELNSLVSWLNANSSRGDDTVPHEPTACLVEQAYRQCQLN